MRAFRRSGEPYGASAAQTSRTTCGFLVMLKTVWTPGVVVTLPSSRPEVATTFDGNP